MNHNLLLVVILMICNRALGFNASSPAGQRRRQLASESSCDEGVSSKEGYLQYFKDMTKIYSAYGGLEKATCLPEHKRCGWPETKSDNQLPIFTLSVGLEGAGHHLWTDLLNQPVQDCVWINARHYNRQKGDGVARTTVEHLELGFREQLKMRAANGKPPCKSIYDAEDSFPTGAIRRFGRVFMRPDIVNLQKLDGKLFRVKYLVILRNVTDTTMSSLRRNFFTEVDLGLRCTEHTMTYVEAALRGVPCSRVFLAHYEHVIASPMTYLEPLSQFLELGLAQKSALKARLTSKANKGGSFPSRKVHKLTQYSECREEGLGQDILNCYKHVSDKVEKFLADRAFMWPSFAGNGYALK